MMADLTAERPYEELRRAVAALSARDLDHAQTQNGVGWNGSDSHFGHILAGAAVWSPRMAQVAHTMVQKYRGQLAPLGIDPSQILVPSGPEQPKPKPSVRRSLTFDGQTWRLRFPFRDDADLLARVQQMHARFWAPAERAWHFPDDRVDRLDLVELVRAFPMDLDARAHLVLDVQIASADERISRRQTLFALSERYEREPVEVPGFAGTLLDTQTSGIRYVLEATADGGGVIIGDKRGLGKTNTVIGSLLVKNAFPALVTVPGSLAKLNWRNEWYTFAPDRTVFVIEGVKPRPLPLADVYLINHEILYAWWQTFVAMGVIKQFVIDEIHWFKTPGSFTLHPANGESQYKGVKRTAAARELATAIGPAIGTSGTAITNRPSEIVEPLRLIGRLADFGGAAAVARLYGDQERRPWVLASFNEKMRSICYLRRTRRDVESPVSRITVSMPLSNRQAYDRAERDLIRYLLETKGYEAATAAQRGYILVLLNTLRQLSGLGKVASAVEWVDEWFEESDQTDKLIVFGYHQGVQQTLIRESRAIAQRHGSAVASILSDMQASARIAEMRRFQTDAATRLIVCSQRAASENITLTAAGDVLTIELDWNPARHEQAEGRADRQGQRRSEVTSYYAIAENSIDGDMMERINSKARVVNAILDGTVPEADDQGMIAAAVEGIARRHNITFA